MMWWRRHHTPIQRWHPMVGPCEQCADCGEMLRWLPITLENHRRLVMKGRS